MEYHNNASGSIGIGINHSQNAQVTQINDTLSDLDLKNAEDIVLVAIECLYEVKIYDFSVFNPINFQIIAMCEFALQYFPESLPLNTWLVKCYTKLGLASLVTELAENQIHQINNQNYERLGAYRFSVYTDFGMSSNLEELINKYKDFYNDEVNSNKNEIVQSFLNRDFENINPLMKTNEKLSTSGFTHAIQLAHTILKVHKYETDVPKMH